MIPKAGPLVVADIVLLGVSATLADNSGPQVLNGFLSLLGGFLGVASLILLVGKWAIGKLEALEHRVADRHAENVEAYRALLDGQNELRALVLGVQGVGGVIADQRLTQKRRHRAARDIGRIMGVLYYTGVWAAKVGEHCAIPYDVPTLPHRRFGDTDDEDEDDG